MAPHTTTYACVCMYITTVIIQYKWSSTPFSFYTIVGKIIRNCCSKMIPFHTHPAAFYFHLSVMKDSNDRFLTCAFISPRIFNSKVCLPDVKSHHHCGNTREKKPDTLASRRYIWNGAVSFLVASILFVGLGGNGALTLLGLMRCSFKEQLSQYNVSLRGNTRSTEMPTTHLFIFFVSLINFLSTWSRQPSLKWLETKWFC